MIFRYMKPAALLIFIVLATGPVLRAGEGRENVRSAKVVGDTAASAREAAMAQVLKEAIIKEYGEETFNRHKAALGKAIRDHADLFLTNVQGTPAKITGGPNDGKFNVSIRAQLHVNAFKEEVDRVIGASRAPDTRSIEGSSGEGGRPSNRNVSGDKQGVVTATGIGKDADAALRNALRNAVRQVVGTLVDAQQLVSNDALVKDEILTHSAGYVRTHRMVGTPVTNDDGLVEVTITATVNNSLVAEKMRNLGIIGEKKIAEGNVKTLVDDFENEKAAAIGIEDAIGSAEEMMEKLLEDFHDQMLNTLDVSLKGQLKSNARESAVEAEIHISINQRKYSTYVREFTSILRKILGPSKIKSSETIFMDERIFLKGGILGFNEPGIAICSALPVGSGKTSGFECKFTVYSLSPGIGRLLTTIPQHKHIVLVARIIGKGGEVLGEKRIDPLLNYIRTDAHLMHLYLFPVLAKDTSTVVHINLYPGKSRAVIPISIVIPPEDLGNIDKMQFAWETVENAG